LLKFRVFQAVGVCLFLRVLTFEIFRYLLVGWLNLGFPDGVCFALSLCGFRIYVVWVWCGTGFCGFLTLGLWFE